ncbi:hypothetical protein, partial [Methylobacterium sp. WL19]|uniref:hypothetical protein n=1 Tax=Methylobacterium sp. WL19 TaxID=2603896 RepID=UPI001AEF0C24
YILVHYSSLPHVIISNKSGAPRASGGMLMDQMALLLTAYILVIQSVLFVYKKIMARKSE